MSAAITTTKRPIRVIRNFYLCEECTRAGAEWHNDALTVGPDYCPTCDRETEPYASEARIEMTDVDHVEKVHVTRHTYYDRPGPGHPFERIQGWQATFNGPDDGVAAGDGRTPLKAIADLFDWEGIECDPASVSIVWE